MENIQTQRLDLLELLLSIVHFKQIKNCRLLWFMQIMMPLELSKHSLIE